ncbi:DUF2490 domain-containing protein [Sphingomonas koreensis]
MAQQEDQELWLTTAATFKLADKTKLETDVVARFGNDPGGLYEVEVNAMLLQEVGDGFTIGGGYTRAINYSNGNVTRTEDRLRAQVGMAGALGKVKLSGRVRLEYRMRSDGDDTGFRLRPQVKAVLPVGGPFSLVGHHESFILLNDTDWGQIAGYERMRNFAGVSWKVNKTVAVEAGYLNQYNFGRDIRRDVMDHALTMSLGLSF